MVHVLFCATILARWAHSHKWSYSPFKWPFFNGKLGTPNKWIHFTATYIPGIYRGPQLGDSPWCFFGTS